MANASSGGAIRGIFDFKLAAAFEDKDTLGDVRLFPPLETFMASEFGG